MGCNCGGPSGYVKVYQHVAGGKLLAEHTDQQAALAAVKKHGGRVTMVYKLAK